MTEYWKLKEGALDHTLWRTCFGRGYGPVIGQITEWMNKWTNECICIGMFMAYFLTNFPYLALNVNYLPPPNKMLKKIFTTAAMLFYTHTHRGKNKKIL